MEELAAADPRRVGRYRILARLGAGGMGRVYLGRSTSGRMVAVKVVRAELAEDPDFRRRFAREVDLARRVTGFFTAAVVDADPEGSPAWLATAYVPGMPLDAAVRAHGAWPRRSLLVLGAGLVEALEAIHGAGLVHRDLKPSNVLLAADGPRVIDFGISIASEASVLTQTGMVIGTPGFMSPEQITGATVGPASDVFSLGAVLAFAGTGSAPFGTGSPHSVNFRAVYEAPALDGLPEGTEFVGRCLEKDPGRRPTVPELLAEFAQTLGETAGQTYAGGLPNPTAWLPEAVALALTTPAASDPVPVPDAVAAPAPDPVRAPAPTPDLVPAPDSGPAPDPLPGPGQGAAPESAAAQESVPEAGRVPEPGPVPESAPAAASAPGPAPAPEPGPVPPSEPVPVPTPGPVPAREPAGEPASESGSVRESVPAPEAVVPDPRISLSKRPDPAPAAPDAPPAPPAPATLPVGPAATAPVPVTHRTAGQAPSGPTAPSRLPGRLPGRSRVRRLVAVALAAALVTGGGITALLASDLGKGTSGQQARGGGPSGSGGAATGFDAAVGNVVNASAKRGGTLRLHSSEDADSWDPARSYYGWVWNFQRLYTRTLLTYDAKPGKAGLALVPDLAAAQPEVSPDGRTYTFRLKSGLTFEDGSPITSKDVKYGIERGFAIDVVNGGPVYLAEVLDQGQNYQGPYKDRSATGLKSVLTPDDRTIVFRLARADTRFPYLLAMTAAAPVPRERDNGDRYGMKPVSSGPYRFASYKPGQALALVRNENWDRATDPVRKALPDRIELTITGNAEELAGRLLDGSGTVDLDARQGGLPASAVAKVMQDEKLRAHADAPHNGYVRFVTLVSKTAPFDNAHCRKAVMYAADTKALQYARGGPTAGTPQGTVLPPTVPGADAYDPFGLTAGAPRRDKAKAELRACGRPNGFSVKFAVRNTSPKEVQSAEALRQALEAVGITVEIDQMDAVEFFEMVGSPAEIRKKGYGLLALGWSADFPHGSGFLQPLVDGRLITPAANSNYAQIDDPGINALLDEAKAETDLAEATALVRQINHKVADGAYYLPVVAEKVLNYRNPRLTNAYVHEAYGMLDFQALGTSDGK
ncbi:ABC transporter substrate-binding protein [Streptomyces sp. NPDC126499]|uniref:ABC transporter substrate-binding protein n=1 Tax=Streptomyces sp. NPDC126499 TaxID=3155314 RepID=UPI00331BCA0C